MLGSLLLSKNAGFSHCVLLVNIGRIIALFAGYRLFQRQLLRFSAVLRLNLHRKREIVRREQVGLLSNYETP
jgi:hypothetical protein